MTKYLKLLLPLVFLGFGPCSGDESGSTCEAATENFLAKCPGECGGSSSSSSSSSSSKPATRATCRAELIRECEANLMKTSRNSGNPTPYSVAYACAASAPTCGAIDACFD